ncbi:hypothetical protein SKP52_07845 [Sphingopyxis fribergensis]|uniref:Uncharacterized protein n=2 Tax=Sphingopyxis fribergensis TaxID=1515612 RepID=A0A0A7PGW2_9SPHN|nr:hypothetical protein SKP52_07845 [Sphingopyxis fribergensis]
MSREQLMTSALRYLDREGSMSASDICFFAGADPWLYARLCNKEPCSAAELDAALPHVLNQLDAVIAKLTKGRAALAQAVPA